LGQPLLWDKRKIILPICRQGAADCAFNSLCM
jgi:hypothetical protein